jgi:UDP-2,3-diacylglucosamine pyrophosphatase LpxH
MLNAVACAAANGFQAVTCGHTHYAEDSVCDGIRYVNTGAWTEMPAFCLRIGPANMRLDRIDPRA